MPKCRYCNRPTPDPQDPHLRDRRVSHYDSDGHVVCLRKRCNTVRFLKEAIKVVEIPRLPTREEKASNDPYQRDISETRLNTDGVILDLYCSAGGVGKALTEMGFDVIGVDIEDYSGKYPGKFYQGDASVLDTVLEALDEYGYSVSDVLLVWFSPPCLAYTPLSNVNASRYDWDETPKERYPTIPELNVHEIAEHFEDNGSEYIIENVSRCDDLRDPIEVNGHAFGMGLECRHKFETSFSCPGAVGKGVTVMMQGHSNKRAKMARLKGVPDTWTMKEINSAIPKQYVHYLIHHSGLVVGTPPELDSEVVEA